MRNFLQLFWLECDDGPTDAAAVESDECNPQTNTQCYIGGFFDPETLTPAADVDVVEPEPEVEIEEVVNEETGEVE